MMFLLTSAKLPTLQGHQFYAKVNTVPTYMSAIHEGNNPVVFNTIVKREQRYNAFFLDR